MTITGMPQARPPRRIALENKTSLRAYLSLSMVKSWGKQSRKKAMNPSAKVE